MKMYLWKVKDQSNKVIDTVLTSTKNEFIAWGLLKFRYPQSMYYLKVQFSGKQTI